MFVTSPPSTPMPVWKCSASAEDAGSSSPTPELQVVIPVHDTFLMIQKLENSASCSKSCGVILKQIALPSLRSLRLRAGMMWRGADRDT